MPPSQSRKSASPRKQPAAKKGKAEAKKRPSRKATSVASQRPSPARKPTSSAPSARKQALAFDADLAVEALRKADPTLGRAIDSIGEFTLGRDLRAAKSVYAVLT